MISRFVVVAIALTFIAAYVAEAQVVTDGLIAYWTFDDADIVGDVAVDVIGGHDGTIIGAPEIIAGKVNEALKFNGSTDDVEAEIPDNLLANGATIELWFQQEAPTGWGIIVKISPDIVELSIADGVLEMWSPAARFNPEGSYSNGEWHHVALTVSDDTITLYVDGGNAGDADGSLVFEAVSGVTIARDPGFDFWTGMVDEVRIYGRPLSEAEILQNMAAEGLAAVEPADKLAETWGNIKVSN